MNNLPVEIFEEVLLKINDLPTLSNFCKSNKAARHGSCWLWLVACVAGCLNSCFFSAQQRAVSRHCHAACTSQVSECETGLVVGAGVTLSTLEEVLKQQVATQPPHKTRGFAAAAEQLRWFAGALARSLACCSLAAAASKQTCSLDYKFKFVSRLAAIRSSRE